MNAFVCLSKNMYEYVVAGQVYRGNILAFTVSIGRLCIMWKCFYSCALRTHLIWCAWELLYSVKIFSTLVTFYVLWEHSNGYRNVCMVRMFTVHLVGTFA